MPRVQQHPEHAKGHLTKSLTMASICSWATFTSSVGPSKVILSSPSVNSMCTYHSRIRKEMVRMAQWQYPLRTCGALLRQRPIPIALCKHMSTNSPGILKGDAGGCLLLWSKYHGLILFLSPDMGTVISSTMYLTAKPQTESTSVPTAPIIPGNTFTVMGPFFFYLIFKSERDHVCSCMCTSEGVGQRTRKRKSQTA